MRLADNIVIVVDNSNYKSSYAEKCPFKAKVLWKFENEIEVKSLSTGKEYELYYDQILEALEPEQIKQMLNVNEWGNW